MLKMIYDNWDKHWCYTFSRSYLSAIEGNPNHSANDGLEGLAWHHCLGYILNHAVGTTPNVRLVTINTPGFASPNLLYPYGDSSNEMVLIMTTRDCYAHEQALIHYDPNATMFYTTRFHSDVPPILEQRRRPPPPQSPSPSPPSLQSSLDQSRRYVGGFHLHRPVDAELTFPPLPIPPLGKHIFRPMF